MQFNKSKFNKGRFNTSESRILVASVGLEGSGKIVSGLVRITFLQSNIVNGSIVKANSLRATFGATRISSYGRIAAIPTRVMLTGGSLDGSSELNANLINELFGSGVFSGSSEILATLEIQGIITIKTRVVGEGSLTAIPVTVLNVKSGLNGRGNLIPLPKRETHLSVGVVGKANLDPRPIAIRFGKPTIDGEGRININITKVILMAANAYGYGDVSAAVSKLFYGGTSIVNYGNINATVQIDVILKVRLGGEGEILVTPYAIYSPPFIILPTKLLIEDITTKAVIV